MNASIKRKTKDISNIAWGIGHLAAIRRDERYLFSRLLARQKTQIDLQSSFNQLEKAIVRINNIR